MKHETFQQLVNNITRDGGLASVPLCHKGKDGILTVLSGNHRVMAARQAGLDRIVVMFIEKDLTKGEKIAIQISHNALVGQDDDVILRELYQEIDDIALKMYAGIDSEVIKELEKLEFTSIAEAKMDFKTITLAFLPEEADELAAALEHADLLFSGEESYIASVRRFDEVFSVIADIKEKYNIVSNPTAFMKLVSLARERIDECETINSPATLLEKLAVGKPLSTNT
jgi:hypothetical protein